MSRPAPHASGAVTGIALLSVIVACTGCALRTDIREARPESAHAEAWYRATPEQVVAAFGTASRARGQSVTVLERTDSATDVLAERARFLSADQTTRAWVEVAGAASLVRVRLLSLGSSNPVATSLSRTVALDGLIGPGRVAPRPGDRVRGTDLRGVRVEGVISGDAVVTGAGERVDLDELSGLHIRRGSHGHGPTLSWLGLAVGAAVALTRGREREPCSWLFDEDCPFIDLTPALEVGAGMLVGGFAGLVVGSLVRTSVWSPFDRSGAAGAGR